MDKSSVNLAIMCGANRMNGIPVSPGGVLYPNLSPAPGDNLIGTMTSFTTHWSLTVTTTRTVCPKFSAAFASALAFAAYIEIIITMVLVFLFKMCALIEDKKGVLDIGNGGILSHDKALEIEKATQAKREGGAPQTTGRLDGEASRLTPEVQMRIDNAQDNAAANAELIKLVHASCDNIEYHRTTIEYHRTTIDTLKVEVAANAELIKLVHASCDTIEDLRTIIETLKVQVDALQKVTSTDARAVGQEEAKSAARAERLAHNAEHRSSLRVRSSQPLGLARPVEGLAEGPADGAKPVLQTGPDLSPMLYTPLRAAEGANKEAAAAAAVAMFTASIVDKAPVRRKFHMKQTVRTVVRRLEEAEELEAFGA
jgi:hypothetical protein